MERYAWTAKVKEGMIEEYKRRHDAIWQELLVELRRAGIRNYTIWLSGNTLFGYYECEYGCAFAAKTQGESKIVAEWEEMMSDILEREMDPVTGAQMQLEQVFLMP